VSWPDVLAVVAAIGGVVVLQRWILPRLGGPT